MVKIVRSPVRLYRSPDIKSSRKKRSRVFDIIPLLDDEKKQKQPSIRDQRWEMRFLELKRFKEKYGHCEVLLINKRYKYLALWGEKQRGLKRFNPNKFDPDRLRKLNEIGFNWSPRDEHWDGYYSQLKAYKKKYGHCDVIFGKEYTGLRLWCIRQRRFKKNLSAQRMSKLNVVGFLWTPVDERWERGFAELKKYRERFGHCDVVRKKPWLHLYSWVQVQRLNYRKGIALTSEKIARLNKIEFIWKGSIKPVYSDEEVLGDLRRLFKKLKRLPTPQDVINHGKYYPSTYFYRFGGVIKAREKAGLGSDKLQKEPVISEQELLQELHRLAKVFKRPPTYNDLVEHAKYSYSVYSNRFGGIEKAKRKAGLL